MGRSSRWEYLKAIHPRYRQAHRQEKKVILNEFCRTPGYRRKYAIRLLNGPPPGRGRPPCPRRPRTPTYSTQVISVLGAVWEAAGYPCGVRLKALLPLWMPWTRKRFRLTPAVEKTLLRISARQIDRRLRGRKDRVKHRLYGQTKPGTLLKHMIDRKSTRLNSSHDQISYAVFCLKKKKKSITK